MQSFWRFFIVFLMLSIGQKAAAQEEDSLQLDFDILNWKDIKSSQGLSVSTKVISGSRSEKKIEDLPFAIFVITQEEIQQNGYLTLTDALKRLPGIRVSQPGSGIEGETFLMRGLSGNTYTKILINDVPIKPFLVSGMPIGAQIPIREAERIEVIYGPVATLYGADASAGVINIILKDSERPVYAQADLGLGGLGYRNLDILFGGKVGQNKKVLSFKVFGNYTSFSDRNVKYDLDSLYNPEAYQRFLRSEEVSYLNHPNYSGTEGSPILNKLPHLSNSLGVELKYRNWKFSYLYMYRRDHSAIGLSPMAVSYANPLNFFGENITSTQLTYSKNSNRFRLKAGLSALIYGVDESSSNTYVLPAIGFLQHNIAHTLTMDNSEARDSLNNLIDNTFYTGSRFSSAGSFEAEAELLLGYTFSQHIELAGGVSTRFGIGSPLVSFSSNPIDELEEISSLNPIGGVIGDFAGYLDFSAFIESYINLKKWQAIIGTQVFRRETDFSRTQPAFLNPRLALQYRWTNKFSLRASMSESYRYPSPFYSSNSYTIDADDLGILITGANLSPEKTFSVEVGSRWTIGNNVSGDIAAYYTRTSNFIGYDARVSGGGSIITLGYFNEGFSFAKLYGIQSRIVFEDILPTLGLNVILNVNYSKGQESRKSFSLDNINSINPSLIQLDGLRSQPDWIVQLDIEVNPKDKFRFLFENTLMTSSLRRNAFYYRNLESTPARQVNNAGFYTLDFTVNYRVNRQLLTVLKINNFFNTQYAGIGSSTNLDGLFYNPQSLRNFRIGVNYRLQ